MKKINLCDRKKATALLDLVVEFGLAPCIDDAFDYGRARKFRLSEEVRQIRDRRCGNIQQSGATTTTAQEAPELCTVK